MNKHFISIIFIIIVIISTAVNSIPTIIIGANKEHHYADIYCIAKYDKCNTHCKELSEPYRGPCVKDCMEFCELGVTNNQKS
ncbi:hypothetical protein C1645_792634, partial [Glomus cerebriforme]